MRNLKFDFFVVLKPPSKMSEILMLFNILVQKNAFCVFVKGSISETIS
ncbi:hypothetical protein SAMN02927921_04266 [Sinomicrobium oceani]|uniref:Uncharacterized protein n=1 Tax=Sinomicrobium oceani TaxID=1150368 RepID=A0A1K1S0B3_9FLAO|nr:hypothetical protein SAMN02927921_04266 [Sinomicrobium oceani]